MSHRIYLAARYSRREELCGYRTELNVMGFDVQARWLDGQHEIVRDAHGSAQAGDRQREEFAREDFADCCAASVVISFTEEPRTTNGRGGRHVEFGVALALSKIVVVIGPRENVFHHLPGVIHFDKWPGAASLHNAIEAFEQMEAF